MALPSPKNKMYRIINNNGNTGSTNCSPSSKIVLGGWFAMCSLKYTVKAKAVRAKAMANAEHVIKKVLLNFLSKKVPNKVPIIRTKPTKMAPTYGLLATPSS